MRLESDEMLRILENRGGLFQPDDDWWHNARVGPRMGTWDAYADGYYEAASRLVDGVMKERAYLDILIYPICFNYRHYLELRLKELTWSASCFIGQHCALPSNFQECHDIMALWAKCRRVLEALPFSITMEELSGVEYYINQFAEVDRGSFAFRYPTKRSSSGAPSLPNLTLINVRHFAEVMTAVRGFLDGTSLHVDTEFDRKMEYLAVLEEAERHFQDGYGG